MPPRARFRSNYKGIGEMLRSAQMQREMETRAEQVKDKAKSLAPQDSGRYADSFRVETGAREGAKSRAVSKVINYAPNAPYVEWGTSRTPRYRVMGKAAGDE
ncbi:HK97 gp10 family phage protein [Streptosporangium sp. NPDC050855]|uniref:HK97 gp10 family phage protein n=1 Tax=Streptosporangium sp. NPDC050855 TaxID=3366194 RepID=UPI003787DC20